MKRESLKANKEIIKSSENHIYYLFKTCNLANVVE